MEDQAREPDGPVDRFELLAAYDAQLRGHAEVATAETWDRSGPLWRAVSRDRGFVSYESLAGYDVRALVAATLEHYTDLDHISSVEWKTRGHDDLPGLDAQLRQAGFEPEEVETVMVGRAERLAVDVDLRPGLRVVRLDQEPDRSAALAEASAVQGEVFGFTFDLERLVDRRGDRGAECQVWGVRDDAPDAPDAAGRLVALGRLELVPDCDIAGLWSGGTLEAWRGLGVYRALTAARARAALAAGRPLLHSDCTAMSRPILERSGLVAVTTTTPYVWSRS